ncbi:MAG TPA: hypothetical protein VGL11_15025 [Candidatus Binatia bacterium]
MTEAAQPSRALGYLFLSIALIAAAIALFFGYYGAKLVYLAAIFGGDASLRPGMETVLGILSYISVVTAAVIFPFVALIAAAVSVLCWRVALRRVSTQG